MSGSVSQALSTGFQTFWPQTTVRPTFFIVIHTYIHKITHIPELHKMLQSLFYFLSFLCTPYNLFTSMPSLPNHITLFLVLSPYHPTGAPGIQIFPKIQSPADRKRGIPEEGNFDRCWEYVFLLVQERIPYPFSLRDSVIAGGQSCTAGIKNTEGKKKKKKKKACRLVWGLTQLI